LDCERNWTVVWPTKLNLKWIWEEALQREMGCGFGEIIGLRRKLDCGLGEVFELRTKLNCDLAERIGLRTELYST
jgi:hypothetical protein